MPSTPTMHRDRECDEGTSKDDEGTGANCFAQPQPCSEDGQSKGDSIEWTGHRAGVKGKASESASRAGYSGGQNVEVSNGNLVGPAQRE